MSEQREAKRLGEILVEEGVITDAQLRDVLQLQTEEGGLLGRLLVKRGLVHQDDIVTALVKQCRIPHLKIRGLNIDPAVIQLAPIKFIREHRVVPVDRLGTICTVAMEDPLDFDSIDKLREMTGLRIKPVVCTYDDMDDAILKYCGYETQDGVSPEVDESATADPDPKTESQEIASRFAPDARYTFDDFVLTDDNDLAIASARSTAESQSVWTNPVLLLGPCGSGKTHVMHAMGSLVTLMISGSNVACLGGENWVAEVESASKGGILNDLAATVDGLNGLMIDDVDDLSSQPDAAAFLLERIQTLVAGGQLVVLGAKCAAEELAELLPTWRPMLSTCTMITLAALPQDLVLKVTRERVRSEGLDLSELVIQLAVVESQYNPKKALEGLRKLIRYAAVTEQDLTPSLAAEVFKTLREKERQQVTSDPRQEATGMQQEPQESEEPRAQFSEDDEKRLLIQTRAKVKGALGAGAKGAYKGVLLRVRDVYKKMEESFAQKQWAPFEQAVSLVIGLIDEAMSDVQTQKEAAAYGVGLDQFLSELIGRYDSEELNRMATDLNLLRAAIGGDRPAAEVLSELKSLSADCTSMHMELERQSVDRDRGELKARLSDMASRVLAVFPDGEARVSDVNSSIEDGELERAEALISDLESAMQVEEGKRRMTLSAAARGTVEHVKSSVFASLFEEGIQEVESLLATAAEAGDDVWQVLEQARDRAEELRLQLEDVSAAAQQLDRMAGDLSDRLEALETMGWAQQCARQKAAIQHAQAALIKGNVSTARDLLSEASAEVDNLSREADAFEKERSKLEASLDEVMSSVTGIASAFRKDVDAAVMECEKLLASKDVDGLRSAIPNLERVIGRAKDAAAVQRREAQAKLFVDVEAVSSEMDRVETLPLTDEELNELEMMRMSLEGVREDVSQGRDEKAKNTLDGMKGMLADLDERLIERVTKQKAAAKEGIEAARDAIVDAAMSWGIDVSDLKDRIGEIADALAGEGDPSECVRQANVLVDEAKALIEEEKKRRRDQEAKEIAGAMIVKPPDQKKPTPPAQEDALASRRAKLSEFNERVAQIVDRFTQIGPMPPAVGLALSLIQQGNQATSIEVMDRLIRDLEGSIRSIEREIESIEAPPAEMEAMPISAEEFGVDEEAPAPISEKPGPSSRKGSPRQEERVSRAVEKPSSPGGRSTGQGKGTDRSAGREKTGVPPLIIPPKEDFLFENYVVGADSRFTCTAARGLSLSPGDVYNPFFVFGMPQVGKTHVLHAIGNAAKEVSEELQVCCLSWDDLKERLIAAGEQGGFEEFKNGMANLDFLLIDDLHFEDDEGEEEVQELFRGTLETAVKAGCQVVLTGLHAPKRVPNMTEDLLSLLEEGVVTGLMPLSPADKADTLEQMCQERNVNLSRDLLDRLSLVLGNIPQSYGSALDKFVNYLKPLKEVKEQHITEVKLREVVEG